ncbi:MAG: hypothetical protein ACREBZ_07050 [Thermoplasmata archaeon]
MWLAWIVAIGIVVAAVVLLMHLGLDVLGAMGSAFHAVESALGRPL